VFSLVSKIVYEKEKQKLKESTENLYEVLWGKELNFINSTTNYEKITVQIYLRGKKIILIG